MRPYGLAFWELGVWESDSLLVDSRGLRID